MRLQKTHAVIAAAVAAVSLTACGGDADTGAAAPPASASASSSASASASAAAPGPTMTPSGTAGDGDGGGDGGPHASTGPGSAPGSGDGGGGGQAPDPATSAPAGAPYGDKCRTADLAFSSSGGMAEGEMLINLRNTGSASCSMHGFPGVDLTGEDGTVSAGRGSGRRIPTVTLAPGESSNFSLRFRPDGGGGSGAAFTSALVTPPDETRSHRVSLAVGIPAGSGSGATVDPVGSGK
ncbi:DUF4232 domain-containing protein [Streptomyces sp. NPDC006296]|uniref:DUF4232 domain-containing protein n=1 Tax=Streptomyces sp. NPDC006296 TaxID=3156746 RepID=UPI0033B46FAC